MVTVADMPVVFSAREEVSVIETVVDPVVEPVTRLMLACQQEDATTVRDILTKQPEAARDRDRTRKTALHYCVDGAGSACAELVLAAEPAAVQARDEDGHTPLHLAVTAANRGLVSLLLHRRAEVNATDHEHHTALHWATVCGELDILDTLFEFGADAAAADIHGAYPIHYAAQMCGPNSDMATDVRIGLATLRRLVDHGADVTVRDNDGRQPLLWAASAGSADALVILVNAGASVSAEDKDGLTALHCAASRGHTDCIDTLIALCGADVDIGDGNGCTPLFYSVTLGHADCTELLLKCAAHPDRQDRKGRTAAHCGASKGQLETLKMLHRHGADLWMRNIKGDMPLHEAVMSGRKELVRWLLEHRPETVNNPNNEGRCPLHVAAINDNIEMCKVLIDLNAHVNAIMRSSKGQLMTPLDSALYRGNRSCAKYLQLHGGVPASTLTDKHTLSKYVSSGVLSESQSRNAFVLPPETYMQLSSDILNSSLSSYTRSLQSAMMAHTPVDDAVQTDIHTMESIGTQVDGSMDARGVSLVSTRRRRQVQEVRIRRGLDISESDDGSDTRQRRRKMKLIQQTNQHDVEVMSTRYVTDPIISSGDEDEVAGGAHSYSGDDAVAVRGADSYDGDDAAAVRRAHSYSGESRGKRAVGSVRERQQRAHEALLSRAASRSSGRISQGDGKQRRRRKPRGSGDVMDDSSSDDAGRSTEKPPTRRRRPKALNGSVNLRAAGVQMLPGRAALSDNELPGRTARRRRGLNSDGDPIESSHSSSSLPPLRLRRPRPLPPTTSSAGHQPVPPPAAAVRTSQLPIRVREPASFRQPHVTALKLNLKPRPSRRQQANRATNPIRFQAEKKVFQDLLELKRVQLRSVKIDEASFVKRLADNFNSSTLRFGLTRFTGPCTYADYEKYLNDQLHSVQQGDGDGRKSRVRDRRLDDLSAVQKTLGRSGVVSGRGGVGSGRTGDPLRCSESTFRCHHAAHAYTGVPCAAYIKRPNHHWMSKPVAARTILPRIDPTTRLPEPVDLQQYDPSRPLRLELSHAGQRRTVQLPQQSLDPANSYRVSFSIRPHSDTEQSPKPRPRRQPSTPAARGAPAATL